MDLKMGIHSINQSVHYHCGESNDSKSVGNGSISSLASAWYICLGLEKHRRT